MPGASALLVGCSMSSRRCRMLQAEGKIRDAADDADDEGAPAELMMPRSRLPALVRKSGSAGYRRQPSGERARMHTSSSRLPPKRIAPDRSRHDDAALPGRSRMAGTGTEQCVGAARSASMASANECGVPRTECGFPWEGPSWPSALRAIRQEEEDQASPRGAGWI